MFQDAEAPLMDAEAAGHFAGLAWTLSFSLLQTELWSPVLQDELCLPAFPSFIEYSIQGNRTSSERQLKKNETKRSGPKHIITLSRLKNVFHAEVGTPGMEEPLLSLPSPLG